MKSVYRLGLVFSAFTLLEARLGCPAETAESSWTLTGPYDAGGQGIRVAQLAVHSALPSTIFAATNQGVFRSTDRAATWTTAPGFTNTGVSTVAIAPSFPSLVYAGGQVKERLLPIPYHPIIFRSSDGGASWAGRGTIPVNNGITTVLAVDPATSSNLYAGTSGGLFKSEDGGRTWSGPGLTGSVLSLKIDASSPRTLFAGTDLGIFKSVNGALDWTLVNSSLYQVKGLAIDPSSPTTIYAGSLSAGPICCLPGTGRLMRSTDAGEKWTEISVGLFPYSITAIVIDPTSPSTLYVSTTSGLFRSSDGGASWTAMEGLRGRSINDLALSLAFPTTLYAATDVGIFKNSGLDNGTCTAGPTALCLGDGRFRVAAAWRVPSQGTSGIGQAMPMTSDTGAFWFFTPNNIELVVKVVDGRAFNNKFWVFYGALSNVEYTITVTDATTGAVKTYFNSSGQIASVADTAAF